MRPRSSWGLQLQFLNPSKFVVELMYVQFEYELRLLPLLLQLNILSFSNTDSNQQLLSKKVSQKNKLQPRKFKYK